MSLAIVHSRALLGLQAPEVTVEVHLANGLPSFTLVGLPSMKDHSTHYQVEIPYVLGLIVTRSVDGVVPGIDDLVAANRSRIKSGMIAYDTLSRLKEDRGNPALRELLDQHIGDLGYGLLLKRYRPDVQNATQEQIDMAAAATVPNVPVLFWAFRIMVGLGFFFILLFGASLWLAAKRRLERWRPFLWLAALCLPLPWIAAELGWTVAEYGRQPWVIDGVLPTALGVSSTVSGNVLFSLLGFFLFYSALAVADLFLMVKYVRLGPESALGRAVSAPEQLVTE